MKHSNFLLIAFLFLMASGAFSQDIIFLIDGSQIKAKVIEINPQYVIYQDHNNPGGPTYLKKVVEVSKIRYEGGKEELIQGESTSLEGLLYGRNIFGYSLGDVLFNDFTLFYEHIAKNQKLSYKIPLSMGYDIKDNPDNLCNIIGTGFGLNFYPTGQGRIKYFMGPHLGFGLANYNENHYWYDYTVNDYIRKEYDKDFIYVRLLIDNGFIYSPIKNFCISGALGLGVRYFDLREDYDGGSKSAAHFTMNVCYRFK